MDGRAATPQPCSAPARADALAAIDLGSNSFRLEMASLQGGLYRRIDSLKETVRLGAGLDDRGMLTEDAMQRGFDCLARFAQRLDGLPAERVRAVATQTLREARNRDAFLRRAGDALGRPIEVLSGREEARLIYAGVARLQPSRVPRLVIDIGGRSTELILGKGLRPLRAESFGIGCVNLSMQYFGDGRLTAAAFRAAQVAAAAEFEEALEAFAPEHWREALGASGSVGAISQILAAHGITDGRVTPAGLRWCIERCVEARRIERLELAGLKADRAPVIAGGLAILYSLFAHFGIATMQPARGALRQGVLFELHDRLAEDSVRHRDLRDASVRELQRRFEVDLPQAARVRRLALELHAAWRPRAPAELRRELGWAATLHELGTMVSHHDHHRHSAYLVGHADIAGFSQSQQRRLAALVLGQRGGLGKLGEAVLDDAFAVQLLCLRLAVLLCHARRAPRRGMLTARPQGERCVLEFASTWSDRHPRTVFLLRQEVAAWEDGAGALRLALHRAPPA